MPGSTGSMIPVADLDRSSKPRVGRTHGATSLTSRGSPRRRSPSKRWREQRAKLSGQSSLGKAIAYCLTRWVALTCFLDDGRICLSNNAAEREVRPIAMGRKNWTFAGSDEGGHRAAAIYTLIQTAKLNDVDPHAWLANVLARLQDHPAKRIDELMPWNWERERRQQAAA